MNCCNCNEPLLDPMVHNGKPYCILCYPSDDRKDMTDTELIVSHLEEINEKLDNILETL